MIVLLYHCNTFKCDFQNVMNFRIMNTVLAILITMRQVGYHNFQKNRPTILFYAFVHTANGLEFIGSFRHAALLFVHTLCELIKRRMNGCCRPTCRKIVVMIWSVLGPRFLAINTESNAI